MTANSCFTACNSNLGIRATQERSKKEVTGAAERSSIQKIDEQTEALVSMIGDNQVDYRFFLGFKLY